MWHIFILVVAFRKLWIEVRHFDDVGGWWLAASLAGLAKKVAARCLKLKEISIPRV